MDERVATAAEFDDAVGGLVESPRPFSTSGSSSEPGIFLSSTSAIILLASVTCSAITARRCSVSAHICHGSIVAGRFECDGIGATNRLPLAVLAVPSSRYATTRGTRYGWDVTHREPTRSDDETRADEVRRRLVETVRVQLDEIARRTPERHGAETEHESSD
jgi:hypothetical protein